MVELTLVAVVVVDGVVEVGVIVGPVLEGEALAIHAGVDIGGYQRCLYQEGARATHGVNEVALAIPAAQLDDSRCQHLVDGCLGLCHAPSALVERFSRRVERDCHFLAIDVNVKLVVGAVEPYRRPLAAAFHEIVGYAVLHAVGHKARMAEGVAVDGAVDGKGVALAHDVFPVKLLHLLIEVVGVGRGEFIERLQHAQSGAEAEVCPVHHLFVTLERHHSPSLFHLLST